MIPYQNNENYEIPKIPRQNSENHENLIILPITIKKNTNFLEFNIRIMKIIKI